MKEEEVKTMEIVEHNAKTLLLKGNTKPYIDELKKMNGKWNWGLRGWIFPPTMREEIEAFVDRHRDKQVKQLVLF